MWKLIRIITWLFLISVSYCQCLNLNGSITCPNNCQCCRTNNQCSQCDYYYRITQFIIEVNTTNSTNTSQIILTNTTISNCTRCTIDYCYRCAVDSASGIQSCTQCEPNYGKQVGNNSRCNFCNEANAYNCRSVNHCNTSLSTICTYCYRYYVDSQGQCSRCSETYRQCGSCNQTQCISCFTNYHLNTSNYKECVPCAIAHCQSCERGPECIACHPGFFLNATKNCQPCIDPCKTCDNNGCLSCNETGNRYLLLSNGTCMPCQDFPNTTNCISCQKTSSRYKCLACTIRYFIDEDSCSACSPLCFSCINSSACLTCISDQYLLSSNSSCKFCSLEIANCQTCANSTICLSCSYGFAVAILANQCTSCSQLFLNCENCTTALCLTCQLGSFMVGQTCQPNFDCESNCLTCEVGAKTNCVTCSKGYFLQNSSKTCTQCSDYCAKCLSSISCQKCVEDFYLNGSFCAPCPNGTYYLNTIQDCLNCSSFCISCTVTECITCESALFAVSPLTGQCQDLCGDGYVISLPCDGGKGIANDGCSDDCTIEPGYNCTYANLTNITTPSNTQIMTSQCSYTGQLTFSLLKASQSLFSNRIKLVFQVKPYLTGMPTGFDSQALLRSVFQLKPLDALTGYTIFASPSEEEVTFDIAYPADISSLSFNFNVNLSALAPNSMFQYLSSQSVSLEMSSIVSSGRLGEYYNQDEYAVNKLIFVVTVILTGLSYLVFFFGLLSRELAGLEHMLLCQTIFLLVLFREKSNFYLQGLLGLKYSISIDIFNSQAGNLSSYSGYLYNINTDSFINNFNINFLLLLLPVLISPIFMFYRIKNKHLPVKKDFGKSVSEMLIGQALLYFVTFNFYGFVAYAYLYLDSAQQDQFLNMVLMAATGLFTVFSWSNLFFRPEVVGSFRSAFSSYKNYNHYEPQRSELMKKVEGCVSWRVNGEKWKEFYRIWSVNFFFVLLAYQITAAFLIIYSLNLGLALLQGTVLILLFLIKPYLKPIEKMRSLFTFSILLLANFINFIPISSIAIPALLIGLLSLHLLLAAFVVVNSSYLQLIKKCTERSEIVRKMFHEKPDLNQAEHIKQQREVVNDLIKKYHCLAFSYRVDSIHSYSAHHPANNQQEKAESKAEAEEEIQDHEYLLTEQRILGEENKHLRYIEGMKFIQKYGNEVNNKIIIEHYAAI